MRNCWTPPSPDASTRSETVPPLNNKDLAINLEQAKLTVDVR